MLCSPAAWEFDERIDVPEVLPPVVVDVAGVHLGITVHVAELQIHWRIDLDGRPAADALQAIRNVDAPRLVAMDRTLRGDVELIVAKALAKSPAERYPSAAAFAEDLERSLADEPVSARRQSRLYLLRKSIRRHREWFVLGALALASLVTVAVAASFTAALHAEGRSDRAGEWLGQADEGARQLPYPDSHLDRLLTLVHQRWGGT